MAEVKARCELCKGEAPAPASPETKTWVFLTLDDGSGGLICPACDGLEAAKVLEDQRHRLAEEVAEVRRQAEEAAAEAVANGAWMKELKPPDAAAAQPPGGSEA